MTVPEINDTFEDLATILREAGLGWIEEDVRADLTEGKLEVVGEADLPRQQDGPSRRKGLKSGEEFLRAQEYSPEERLLALIDAIQETVVQSSDFEMELVRTFVGHEGVRAIAFADEQNSMALDLDDRQAAKRHEAATALRRQLADLREEVISR
jgi:hypothetical protein